MPTTHFPPYPRKPHKCGQARIRFEGKDHWLGKHDSPPSLARYDLLRERWMRSKSIDLATLTIDELCIRFVEHAETYYRRSDGSSTGEVHSIRAALRPLVREWGPMLARDFGPLKLKTVRQLMIHGGNTRPTINKYVDRIKRMFRWAVENELIPAGVGQSITMVRGLSQGRTDAIETQPIRPVESDRIEAIKPLVSRQVWAMIQLQLKTAARPGEIVSLRVCDLKTEGNVWEYRPPQHKTSHRGKARIILIGPAGQAILEPFLRESIQDGREAFVFSPTDAEVERSRQRRLQRLSPMTPSQIARRSLADGQRRPKERYTVGSYRRAIARACELAFGMPQALRAVSAKSAPQQKKELQRLAAEWRDMHCWHPNQLRHNAGTEVRKEFGLEAAQLILGHAEANVTEIYAERDMQKAREIAARIG